MTKPDPGQQDRRRRIPSMEAILASSEVEPLIGEFGRDAVKTEFRRILDGLRSRGGLLRLETAVEEARESLEKRRRPDLRIVINATGVLVHTNLGRSPLSPVHLENEARRLGSYSNLEIDLESGTRGSRQHHIERIARELFGCEAALLVNNNAAGVLLLLSAVAAGREVVVSRGELVEIGGSFRVPDIIQQGGARLREVGTTNRTRTQDYEAALGDRTAAILVVRQSNFRIVGFTESPPLGELVGTAHAHGLPVILDEGSGRVVDLSPYGLPPKETIAELIRAGVDVVTCSTDKLIGASQGGLVLGRQDLVDACRHHPLMRALRPGKETFTLVAAALSAFLVSRHEEEIPLYTMLATPLETLRERARQLAETTGAAIVETEAVVGGGTTPLETIASMALAFDEEPEALAARLRSHDPPVIGRIQEGRLLLDLRTVFPHQDSVLAEALSGTA